MNLLGSLLAGATLLVSYQALAQDAALSVTIKDHRFSPAELRAPANTPITITVKNEDSTPEEFESKPLKVEKIAAGGETITVKVRPLAKGKYRFFGDYREKTAEGHLIVE